MNTPDELYEKLVAAGEDWADKNAASRLLKENQDSVLSQIVLNYLGKAGSVSKAEKMAESDSTYISHIQQMVEAERKANIARVNYDGIRVYIELLRSKEATDRVALGR